MGLSCQGTVHIQVVFTVIAYVWEYLKADRDGKPRMLLILWFNFIITLVTIEYVLQSLLPLATFLQANYKCDLVEAAKETITIISQLQKRVDSEVWNRGPTIYEGAVKLATTFQVLPSKPCWKTKTPRKCSLLVARNEYMTINGSRSLLGSVHLTEITGVSDTKKISPAVRTVPR